MTPAAVGLRGSGVSVAAAARLLADAGFAIDRSAGPQSAGPQSAGPQASRPAPVVLLGDAALGLLRDIFGQPALFADLWRIERRVVAWGGATSRHPHGAVVAGAGEVAAALDAAIPATAVAPARAIFTLCAGRPFPGETLRRFGDRAAFAAAVTLAPHADARACHIEALSEGWLFLMPQSADRGWLLAVGAPPDRLLGESRLVAREIAAAGSARGPFPAAPAMIGTLGGPDWLAMGSGAIRFDPICGDGTAQAAREAILAAAVVGAVRDGGDRAMLVSHYQSMLIAAMRRHLTLALPFYRSGGAGPWWQAGAEAIVAGHAWCTAVLARTPEPRFRLQGSRLVPRGEAA